MLARKSRLYFSALQRHRDLYGALKREQKKMFWIHEIRAIEKEQGHSFGGDVSPQQEYNKTFAQRRKKDQGLNDNRPIKDEFVSRSLGRA